MTNLSRAVFSMPQVFGGLSGPTRRWNEPELGDPGQILASQLMSQGLASLTYIKLEEVSNLQIPDFTEKKLWLNPVSSAWAHSTSRQNLPKWSENKFIDVFLY